jgi:hypothetical protein
MIYYVMVRYDSDITKDRTSNLRKMNGAVAVCTITSHSLD